MKVENKVAIITGGGTGVGRATALELARRGCSVVINYSRSEGEAERTAADCRSNGAEAIAVKADVSDDGACRQLVERAVAEFGALHILVQSAGATVFVPHGDLEGVSERDWAHVFGVNVQGSFQCARAARDAIVRSGGGEIINVSSIAGLTARGSSIPYCASKAALNTLTVALARALAPEIRVNAVAPGFITGRWLEEGLGEGYEAAKASSARKSALGRVSDPEDIAAAILSIVTGSDQVTGQILVCDGGLSIGAL